MSDDQGDPALADLRGTIDQLSARMAALEATVDRVARRLGDGEGTVLEQLQDNLADVASGDVVGALWQEVREVRAALPAAGGPGDDQTRAAIDALRAELSEGLVVEPSESLSASLDVLRTEVDGLRATLGEVRAATGAGAPGVDDATLEQLRDDIRAAGAVPDQLVEALRDELKALRRRIAVKASEKVLDEEQLAQIADAVAARLDRG